MQLLLTRAMLRLGTVLPLFALQGLGVCAGWLGSVLPNRPRQLTERNLELCFPEWPVRERRRNVRRSLAEDGKSIAELGAFWRRSRRRVLALVRDVEGLERLERVLAEGRGAILAGPHLGAWELAGLWLSTRGRMATLYRPPHSREFESLMVQSRGRFGARQVPAGRRGLRELIRELKAGAMVAILPDQLPSGGQGEFAPFFGIQAYTMTLLPRLAQRTGVPVLLAWAERLPRGRGFRMRIDEPWEVDGETSMAEAVAELNRRVEAAVRVAPLQYQWSYKRFHHRPPGEPPIYPRKRRYSKRPPRKIE